MSQARFAQDTRLPSWNALHLDQARLNIEVKSRTSRLPWKGQFSPDLIGYLMEAVCPESRSFIDPFCGSGTVLFEAVERGCSAIGTEVNPAAWHLAYLATFPTQLRENKQRILGTLKSLAADLSVDNSDMFSRPDACPHILDDIRNDGDPFRRMALASAVLLGMGDKADLTRSTIAKGAFSVAALLNSTRDLAASAKAILRDSRSLPLADSSVDGMITSPPYINVFNYHQNYRPATELLGWNPLEAARSEIGSNRKHRMNRFLTVIQYAMDMAQALNEANRVLVEGAPAIVVIGRTSNVLGTAFQNSALLHQLMMSATECGPIQTAERVFTNRFGESIFEDLLIRHRIGASVISLETARLIGRSFLEEARNRVPDQNRAALEDAIDNAKGVAPSPLLQISTPAAFADRI